MKLLRGFLDSIFNRIDIGYSRFQDDDPTAAAVRSTGLSGNTALAMAQSSTDPNVTIEDP